MKSATFCWTMDFLVNGIVTLPQILHEGGMAFHQPNDAKDIDFWWINYRLWDHWNQSLFWGFV
jgi:hypothetical protein